MTPKKLEFVTVPDKAGINIGIDETMDVVDAAVSLANAIIDSYSDGKLTVSDIFNFIKPFTKLPKAISGIDQVPYELDDLQEAELNQLIEFVQNELEVDDLRAKLIVQKSLEAIYSLYELLKVIRG